MQPLTQAQQDLVLSLLHVAERYAQRFARPLSSSERAVSYDDYYMAGVTALCDCVQRRGRTFTESQFYVYCDRSVYGACRKMQRANIRQENLLSVHVQERRGLDIEGAANDLLAHGVWPTAERIARVLDVSVDEVQAEQASRPRFGGVRPYMEPDADEAGGSVSPVYCDSRDADLAGVSVAAPSPLDLAEASERAERVREAIRALPVPLRVVTHLRFVVVLPVSEIADRLHCSEKTVKNRLRQARALMRAELSDLEDGPPETQPAHIPHSR